MNNVMRHTYKELTDQDKANIQKVKDVGLEFYEAVSAFGSSRELSVAKTKIEEAVMWATKHITA